VRAVATVPACLLVGPAQAMRWIDRRTLSVLFTTLVVAAGLWIAWAARRPLLAFLFAIFFAYLLEPVVSWLERLVGGSRLRAIARTYATIIGTLIVAAIAAAPAVAAQAWANLSFRGAAASSSPARWR
jgi:predicted PurR-regulated permease PerM